MSTSPLDKRRVATLPLLTVTSAAERVGLTRDAVITAIHAGRLPAYKPSADRGGCLLLRPEDVDALWNIRKHPLPLTEDLDDLVNT